MNIKKYFLSGLIGFSVICITAESFVIPKKDKKVSTRTLKENCCDCVTDVLKESPKTAILNAQVQQEMIAMVGDMIEGSFFEGIDKITLAADERKYQEFACRQQEINNLLEQQVAFVMEQKKKSGLKK
ncbi:MAG TPA: hypothetical protein VGT41_01715 [Candidatus Babeliales bacterium]|nr:hypothetical protein [Candidatus Babeliales bacterium]